MLKLRRAIRSQIPVVGAGAALGITAGFATLFAAPGAWAPVLGMWLAAGLTFGLIVAVARQVSRDAVDFGKLHKRLSYTILGSAPELGATTLRQLPPDKRSPLGVLAFQPASAFATAFRDLQDALPNKTVVAFIASAPGDGATTAALSTAISAMQQGRKVIVVDCDLRRRALTGALGLAADEGVLEACESPLDWRSFIVEEEETALHVMPAARPRSAWRSLLAADGLPTLIENLRGAYDLVVLDCPPALGTAEGALIARMADKNIVVAAWDQTPFTSVRNALRSLHARKRPSAMGVYVNRTPPKYRFKRVRVD